MPFTDSDLRALAPKDKRYRVAAGDSIFIDVYPGGGKYFVWKYRFPPGTKGQQRWYQIGPYGRGVGEWTLKKARDEKARLDLLRKQGEDPRALKADAKREFYKQAAVPTLEKVAEDYLRRSKNRQTTVSDYRNMLFNQVLPVLGHKSPVNRFEWNNGGRQKILNLKKGIEARGSLYQSDKCLMVMRSMFEHAIDCGWMQPPNPALGSKGAKSSHVAKHNPTLEWHEVPQLLEDLESKSKLGSFIVQSAVKMTLLTFLRVGSLVPTQWDEFDFKKGVWTIPGSRMKAKQDHHIPITNQIRDLLESLRRVNGEQEYVFYSPRGRTKSHIHPAVINTYLIRIGYKGLLTAHGIRAIPLTMGQEVLGFDSDIIQRQLAHAIGDKIRQAYDHSQFWEERKKFMVAWCDALTAEGLVT
jgi:integrase